MSQKEFIFKEASLFNGVGKNPPHNPYTLRKIKLVDPTTFDTHTVDFDEILDQTLVHQKMFKNGDKVHIQLSLVAPRFGNQDSRALVNQVYPVK